MVARDMIPGSPQPEDLARANSALTRMALELENRIARRTAELLQAEEKYRSIFENAVEGIFQTTPDGKRFLTANSALARIFGYPSPEELMGRVTDIDRQLYVNPEHRQESRRQLKERGEVRAESQVYRRDGSIVWISEKTRAVHDARGRVLYYEGMIEDITDRKSLEAQLLHSQKMESVGRLAGGIAHDFNNLLTAILGYSELLLTHLPPEDPLRQDAEEIKKSAERASTLTRQLLTFSRRQILVPHVLDVNEVVTHLEQMLRRLIGEDIDLVTALDPAIGRVKADPGQIEQVILNLAVNARDAMPQGGKLTIETANVTLDEAYTRQHVGVTPGRYVMLAVSDTGCGMDAETRSHIFEPFFTTKEQGKGTGLGLATVYGIVKQSEGSIWVYSEPGRGATFKIYLPRVEEPVEVAEPGPTLTGRLPQGAETILLVEDEAAVRELARRVLQMQGYTVLEAPNGNEALLIFQQHKDPIHLLLTDTVMPGMGGRELAKRLALLTPTMKVLYMSGYTDEAIVHHGVLEPGMAFLQKPFPPDGLARKVREVLDTPS